jgi:hypothetical protein
MEESLSRLLESERNIGNLLGIQIVRGVKSINHSQFVDDTLLLGGDSTIIAREIQEHSRFFTQASRGLINHNKC